MCKPSTKYGVNPLIPHKYQRPRCSVDGCDNAKAIINCRKDGSPIYRDVCGTHHGKNVALRYGFTNSSQVSAYNAGFKNVTAYLTYQAKKQGFANLTERKNKSHKYRKYRKDYCENIDGRLGFVCTTTIAWSGMLDVDHKNGNHTDNRPRNLTTLCKCCHAFKTNMKKDYLTPGRKTRKKAA